MDVRILWAWFQQPCAALQRGCLTTGHAFDTALWHRSIPLWLVCRHPQKVRAASVHMQRAVWALQGIPSSPWRSMASAWAQLLPLSR